MIDRLGLTLGVALLGAPAHAAVAPCDVTGTVLDDRAQPLGGVQVQVDSTPPRLTTTDDLGAFRFAAATGASRVQLTLADPDGRFEIHPPSDMPRPSVALNPAGGRCTVTLGPGNGEGEGETAGALLALLRDTHRGFTLLDQLGLRAEKPLRIEPFDAVAGEDHAYWVGPRSFFPDADLTRIVLGRAASSLDDPGRPDNREYHELGHHALALGLGALPASSDQTDDGGYYENAGSTRALTEGFAIFFAAMVAQQIEGRPDAARYRVDGAWIDLELDYRPWDLRGRDSVAVASLLWDVVDTDIAAVDSPLTVTQSRIIEEGEHRVLVATVKNPSDTAIDDPRLRVRDGSWWATAVVVPDTLAPGAQGTAALVLPDDHASLDALTLTAGVVFATDDDDDVTIALDAVWAAMREYRSEREQSNGRLFDVADLYRALRGRVDGPSLDALFVAHGLFADRNGDRQRQADEALGLTSHPARTVTVDGESHTWPAFDPRHRLRLPDALTLRRDVEPDTATLVATLPGSAWGGYVLRGDTPRLVVPPGSHPHPVAVMAIADDLDPAVALHESAAALLESIEQHTSPYLVATAQLRAPAAPVLRVDHSLLPWIFIGGCSAVVLGLLLIGFGWPRRRLG